MFFVSFSNRLPGRRRSPKKIRMAPDWTRIEFFLAFLVGTPHSKIHPKVYRHRWMSKQKYKNSSNKSSNAIKEPFFISTAGNPNRTFSRIFSGILMQATPQFKELKVYRQSSCIFIGKGAKLFQTINEHSFDHKCTDFFSGAEASSKSARICQKNTKYLVSVRKKFQLKSTIKLRKWRSGGIAKMPNWGNGGWCGCPFYWPASAKEFSHE